MAALSFPIRREICWCAFRVFDHDGNGKRSVAELAKVLRDDSLQRNLGADKITEMINEFDANRDTELDFDEFMAMMNRYL